MRFLVLGCTTLLLCWGGAVASASPWTPLARPAVGGSDRPLLAVACSSTQDCTAVGGLFAEHWNGRRWSFEPISAPVGTDGMFDYLSGVSCASIGGCMAVGSARPSSDSNVAYDYSPLAELSSGNGWTDQSPAPGQTPNDYLQAVSCPSRSECIAVGQGVAAVLALGWNGTDWKVQLSPIRAAGMSVLEGVSCPSIRRCIAAGYRQPNPQAPFRAIAERWNGVRWSMMRTARVSGLQNTVLNAVSCAGRVCTAVGSLGYRQLVERWNGRRWSAQRTPSGAPYAALNGVSCVSPARCMAVGALTSHSFHSIAEEWNGSVWSLRRPPAPPGGSILWGVSCVTRSGCVAVGQSRKSPLIERWNGTRWSLQPAG